mmetsp:Transcript_10345/g.25426  ORF Transcript_10345/g.25426 Transcript_10345/m.25426 type:complete len:255 (-) Transcript_10345:288-1052(-)
MSKSSVDSPTDEVSVRLAAEGSGGDEPTCVAGPSCVARTPSRTVTPAEASALAAASLCPAGDDAMIPEADAISSTSATPFSRSATTPASSTPARPLPTTATLPRVAPPLFANPRMAAARRCASSSDDSGIACSFAPGTPMSEDAVPTATTSQSYSILSPSSSTTAPPPLLATEPSRIGMVSLGSTPATAPRWNATPVGARSSSNVGATSQSFMVSLTSSYSIGLNTNRSLRSSSVTVGLLAPSGHVSSSRRSAV